jgi:hypothetical protein
MGVIMSKLLIDFVLFSCMGAMITGVVIATASMLSMFG